MAGNCISFVSLEGDLLQVHQSLRVGILFKSLLIYLALSMEKENMKMPNIEGRYILAFVTLYINNKYHYQILYGFEIQFTLG